MSVEFWSMGIAKIWDLGFHAEQGEKCFCIFAHMQKAILPPFKNWNMITLNPHYITDSKGKKVSAILPMKEFKNILEELEELEDIKLYDESKNDNEPLGKS